jgi:adenylate cyclase
MPQPQQKTGWLHRHNLAVVTLAPLSAIVVGTMLNIWYNQTNINPRLIKNNLLGQFHCTVMIYNAVVYSVLLYVWYKWMVFLHRVRDKLRSGEPISESELSRARARTINIPWVIALFCAIGWLGCIPVFLVSLNLATDSLDPQITTHLIISFLISGSICGTQAFFIAEICCLRLLYPEFFDRGQHVQADGGIPGSLRIKWLIWVISTVVCPVSAELLLFLAPDPKPENLREFAIAVAVIFMSFSLLSAWLLARLVIRPIHHLRTAAKNVGEGDLETLVDLQRSDDFGMLIAEFNNMVKGLKEKERVQTMFGRHVGRRAARAILKSSGLSGTNREISVMFVDVRNFTSISESRRPEEVVELLNTFFQNMVEIVEDSGGLLNKFLGDGFMALFGAIDDDVAGSGNHADAAVECGIRMAKRLEEVNRRVALPFDFAIGVGIHTGEAVVGSIGSQQRLEYTAIGDTVNVASRIEGLTKRLERTILISSSTKEKLSDGFAVSGPYEANVRGKLEKVTVYSVK